MSKARNAKSPRVQPVRQERWACEICGEGNDKNPRRKKVQHHLCYDPELTAVLCLRCHLRLHGLGRCFNHPFEAKYGPAYGPLIFAVAVADIYARAEPWLEMGRGRVRPEKKKARNAKGEK